MKIHSKRKRKPIPLGMVDTINAYQRTGRVVTVFPFAGKISLNGFPGIPYADAEKQMREFLGNALSGATGAGVEGNQG